MRPARNKRRNTVVAFIRTAVVLVVIVADASLICVVIDRFITDLMYTGDKRECRKLRFVTGRFINIRRSRTGQEVKLRIIHICIGISRVGSAVYNICSSSFYSPVSYRG